MAKKITIYYYQYYFFSWNRKRYPCKFKTWNNIYGLIKYFRFAGPECIVITIDYYITTMFFFFYSL